MKYCENLLDLGLMQMWLGPVIFFKILLAFWHTLYATFFASKQKYCKHDVLFTVYTMFVLCKYF